MEEKRLAEYRLLTGVQLQWADRGDTHKVMEMQLVVETWIAEKTRIDILVSFEGMKVKPTREINCSMTAEEIRVFRLMVGGAFDVFSDKGWDAWRDEQPAIERFVQTTIEDHVLDAVRPFLKMNFK